MKPHIFFVLTLTLFSCVQIPQESIQLSQAMGEDLNEIYKVHIALVNVHYNDLEGNINSFVDNVYAPFQIGKLVEADIQDMKDGLEDTMSGALAAAPNDPEAAIMALEFMEFFISLVRNDIEDYRSELLRPIQNQRNEILNQLHVSYGNVLGANASITAHLSSIKKVKETQSELLQQLGIEKDINEEIGLKIAEMSSKINEIIDQANKIDKQSDDAIEKFNEIKEKITKLTN